MLKLGDEVRDTVSGFTGIAVARHEYLQGCARVTVQPQIDKDGKLPECENFDEPQLEVITLQKARRSAQPHDTGGPEKFSDTRRF